jgi:hypothetical protein
MRRKDEILPQSVLMSFFEDDWPRRFARHLILAGLCCVLGFGILLLESKVAGDASYWPTIGLATALVALGMIGVLRLFGFAWQSAPIGYLTFLWLFHFPMILIVHLLPDEWLQMPGMLYGWTQRDSWYGASIYAMLCVIAFTVGCGLTAPANESSGEAADWEDTRKFRVGIVTALAGLVGLYYILLRAGGLELFWSAYARLYISELGSDFSLTVFFVSVGCFIGLLSAPRRLLWLPITLQVAGSLPVLLTGARQFALIGPLVLMVLAAKRGLRLGLLRGLTCCLLTLWVISYVGDARSHGVMEGITGTRPLSVVSALVEMGASLETTSLAFEWTQNGEGFLWGGSYWLPFERGLGLVFPSVRADLGTDPRAMHMVLQSRISGLGGSAVAESYYNFSVFGIVVFLVLGRLLARLQANARSAVSTAFLGVVLYAFVFQARNWFINVPTLLFLGSLPIIVCSGLEFVAGSKGLGAVSIDSMPPRNCPAGGRL